MINIRNLTSDELASLECAKRETKPEHNRRVRMVYFDSLRCKDCQLGRSCWTHVEMMVSL